MKARMTAGFMPRRVRLCSQITLRKSVLAANHARTTYEWAALTHTHAHTLIRVPKSYTKDSDMS